MTDHGPPHVVVGVDDLSDCHAALSYAAAEADISGSTLTLVHVVNSDVGNEVDADVDGRDADFGPAERYVSDMTAGRVKVETSVREGPVAAALLELSRTASLVVVEHRRLYRLGRRRLPSVAGQLAGRVRSRLVSVPEDWPVPSVRRGCTVVGLDAIDAEADAVLHCAFARAASDGARLLLVHAWSMSSAYDDALVEEKDEEEWRATYKRRLIDRLEALHLGPQVDVEIRVVHGAPSKALIELSDNADLLLLGRGRAVHPLVHGLGSVPRAVLEDGRCPVEVVSSTRS